MIRVLVGMMLTLTLSGCMTASGPAPAAGPAAPKQAPPPAETAPPPAETVLPPAETVPPPAAPLDDPGLLAWVAQEQARLGLNLDLEGATAFPLDLAPVPAGYDRLVAVLADDRLFLVAQSGDGVRRRLVAHLAETHFNLVKLRVSSDAAHIYIWSQLPFRAMSMDTVLVWDGRTLAVQAREVTDPTFDYFERREQLIAARDLDGLMALAQDQHLLYPGAYEGYYSQPPRILRLAHARALERYRAGSLPDALLLLHFGVETYAAIFGHWPGEPIGDSGPYAEYRLPDWQLAPIMNDYAFFLSESGNHQAAEPILRQVLQVAPDRTVAYLNLADVLWNLGRPEEARAYYRQYLERMQPYPEQVPDRVRARAG